MHRILHRILTAVAALLVSLSVHPQNTILSIKKLPENRYLAIEEDFMGYIWFGSLNGLARYDGYSYFYFLHSDDDPKSLLDNHVSAISNSKDGCLWVGSHKGLQYLTYGYKEFRTVAMPDSITPHITSILTLDDGRVLTSTSSHGVFMVNLSDRDRAVPLRLSVDDSSEKLLHVNSMCQDKEKRIWIGTDRGVLLHDLTTGMSAHVFQGIDEPVIGIKADLTSGRVYIATTNSLFITSAGSTELKEIKPESSIHKIQNLFLDRHGNIYLASSFGWLLHYDPVTEKLTRENSLTSDVNITSKNIEAFYQDSRDNIWLGVAYSDPILIKSDETLLHPRNMNDIINITPGVVSRMATESDGTLWIGFNNRGILMVDSDGIQYEKAPDWHVNDMIIGRDSLLWVCSNDGRLGYYDKQLNKIVSVTDNISYKLLRLAQDNQDRVYCIGLYHGLKRFDPEKGNWLEDMNLSFNGEDKDQNLFYALAIDNRNWLWVGGVEGVLCYDIDASRRISLPESLNGLRCLEIKEDSQGRIWIRTHEQIVMYSPQENVVRKFVQNHDDGVFVMQLTEDGDGYLWSGTRNNLMRMNPESGEVDMFIGVDSEWYLVVSAYDHENGILYAGGNGSLRQFYLNGIKDNSKLDNLFLTGVYLRNELVRSTTLSGNKEVSDRSLSVSDRFEFAFDDNTLSLAFSTLCYGEESNITYEYSLDKSEWLSTFQGANEILLSKLSIGKHTLNVRARMNNSVSDELDLVIVIRAPWYGSVFAKFIYLLIIAFMFALLVSYQYRKYRQKISDSTLDTFTNVAHELCNPLTLIISPIEDLLKSPNLSGDEKNQLIQIRRNSVRVQNTANQLIDIKKFEDGYLRLQYYRTDLISFIVNLLELYTSETARRRITLKFTHVDQELFAWIDRESVDRILTNLLSNALKFTPDKGVIEVRVEKTGNNSLLGLPMDQHVKISVIDSGPGIDEKEVPKLFKRYFSSKGKYVNGVYGHGIGLHMSSILAMKMHGSIQIINRTDSAGVIASLFLPLGKGHIDENDIVSETSEPGVRQVLESMKYELENPGQEESRSSIGREIKVMVIDDDKTILDFIEDNLNHSYNIIKCNDSINIIKTVLIRKPDVIVTDMAMPGADGEEVISALKKNSLTSHIPIIILSGRNHLEDRLKGLEIGADYYMTKPFYIGELKTIINTLVNNRLIVKGKYSGKLDQESAVKPVEYQSSDELFMKKVIDLVNENIANPDFSVENIQNSIGISRTQLFRKLKEQTGFPPARFIQNIRMKQAYNLLKEKKMDVSQIAYAVGFASQTHFSTIFKQYYGMSPVEFIKENSSDVKSEVNQEEKGK